MEDLVVLKKSDLESIVINAMNKVLDKIQDKVDTQSMLTVQEVADLLKCNPQTVRRNRFKLGAISDGGRLKFPKKKVLEYAGLK